MQNDSRLKRISRIKNMAIFNNFDWPRIMRDKGNNVIDFKQLNIIYGRNYSGKTTLSRIIRSLEDRRIPEKYNRAEYDIILSDNSSINQQQLIHVDLPVRVYNEDFVKENLQFIYDQDKDINPFAILGTDNNAIENKIVKLEEDLGELDIESSLIGKEFIATKTLEDALSKYNKLDSEINELLSQKATKNDDKFPGIKYDKRFDERNYNISKIKTDLGIVIKPSFVPLNLSDEKKHLSLIAEHNLTKTEPLTIELKFTEISSLAKPLIEQKIEINQPIQELINDAVLSEWVLQGKNLHQGKMKNCAFCGSEITENRWEQLNEYFNKSSENLRDEITKIRNLISKHIQELKLSLTFDGAKFYSIFKTDIIHINDKLTPILENYFSSLNNIDKQLSKKQSNVFKSHNFENQTDISNQIIDVLNEYNKICNSSNEFTNKLSLQQRESRRILLLNELFNFAREKDYKNNLEKLEGLNAKISEAKDVLSNASVKVANKRKEISDLKLELKDESIGASEVNKYLNDFFGNGFLSLETFEHEDEFGKKHTRFNVMRNGEKAYNLSEGERSLISFSYFMAKLKDAELKGKKPIIWIDDPISSLDSNHIFFVFSLINIEIAKPEVKIENGVEVKNYKYKQLFISTHNLEFLKYLKKLASPPSRETLYLMVARNANHSELIEMPDYLAHYVTEFNYLFHQIYKCSNAELAQNANHDCYYNFGNNARKFLESYLYFKYPDANKNSDNGDKRIEKFFSSKATKINMTTRLNNEYSHLVGLFERASLPIDIPEMKKIAKFILETIQEKDPEQYNALLTSIGEVE